VENRKHWFKGVSEIVQMPKWNNSTELYGEREEGMKEGSRKGVRAVIESVNHSVIVSQ